MRVRDLRKLLEGCDDNDVLLISVEANGGMDFDVKLHDQHPLISFKGIEDDQKTPVMVRILFTKLPDHLAVLSY